MFSGAPIQLWKCSGENDKWVYQTGLSCVAGIRAEISGGAGTGSRRGLAALLVRADTGEVADNLVRRRAQRHAVHQEVRFGMAELVPDLSRTDSWLLFIDGIPQSQVDLDDPGYLEFEYVRRIGHVADLAFPAGDPLRALHLGGGGLTLPRYLAHTRPGSRQLVAELDAELTA